MNGNVFRRENGTWAYRFDAGEDPLTDRRRRLSKSGFDSKRSAQQALRGAVAAHEGGRSVQRDRRTVRRFLEEWHAGVKHTLRPTTWVTYGQYLKN